MLAKAAQTVAAVAAALSPAPAQESVESAVLNSLQAPQAPVTAKAEPGLTGREALQKALQDPPPAAQEKQDKPVEPKTTPVTTAPVTERGKQDPVKPVTPDTKPAEKSQDTKPASSSGADLLRRAQRNQEKPGSGAEPSAGQQPQPTPAPAVNPQNPATPTPGANQAKPVTPAAEGAVAPKPVEPVAPVTEPAQQQQLTVTQLLTMTAEQFLKLSPEQATQALASANKELLSARKDSASLIGEIEMFNRIHVLLDANRGEGGVAQFRALQEIRTSLNDTRTELIQRANELGERERARQSSPAGAIPQPIADVARDINQQRGDIARELKEHDAEVTRRREEFMRDYGRELTDLAREKQEAKGGIGQIDRLINGRPNVAVAADDPAAKILNSIKSIDQEPRYKEAIALALTPVDANKVAQIVLGGGVIDATPKGSAEQLQHYFVDTQSQLRFEFEQREALKGTRNAHDELVRMVVPAAEKERVVGEVKSLLTTAQSQHAERQRLEQRERDLGVNPGELTEFQWRSLEAFRQIEEQATQIGRSALETGREANWQKFTEADFERQKKTQSVRDEIEAIRRGPLGNDGIIRIGNG